MNKNQVNKKLSKLTYNMYFKEIPLTEIFEIVKGYDGLILLDEDNSELSGLILCGSKGYITIKTNVKNLHLNLGWYRMESGNYEVTTYLV